jgi:hypothetical protein
MTLSQDRHIFTNMSLHCADIANAAVPVVEVVPLNKPSSPLPYFFQCGKAGLENSARYLSERNRLSTKAFSLLSRGLEYEGLKPSQDSMVSTEAASIVVPLSSCCVDPVNSSSGVNFGRTGL